MPGISVPWDPARLAPPSPAPFRGFSGEVSPTVLGPRVVLPCVPFPPASFAVCRPVWGLLSGLYPFSRTTSRYRGLMRTVPINPGSGVASLEGGRRAGCDRTLRTEGGALRAVCPLGQRTPTEVATTRGPAQGRVLEPESVVALTG